MSLVFLQLQILNCIASELHHPGWFTQRTSVLSNAMQLLDTSFVFDTSLNDTTDLDDTQAELKRQNSLSRFKMDTPLDRWSSPVKRKSFEEVEDDYNEWLQISMIIINKTPYIFKLQDRWSSESSELRPDSDDVALTITSGEIVKAKLMLGMSEFETNATFHEGMSYSISDKSDVNVLVNSRGIPVKYVGANTILVSPHEMLVKERDDIRALAESKPCKCKTYDQQYIMNSKDDMAVERLQVGGSSRMDSEGAIFLFAMKYDSLIDTAQTIKVDDEALFGIANGLLFEDEDDLFTESQKRLIDNVE